MIIGNKSCDLCGEPLDGKVIGMFKGSFQDKGDEGEVQNWDIRMLVHYDCILDPGQAQRPIGEIMSNFELDVD